MSNLVCKNCCEGKFVSYSHNVENGKCCFCGKSLITDRVLVPPPNLFEIVEFDVGQGVSEKTTLNSLYAYPEIEDFEQIVGYKVNDTFKDGWRMARTTNAQLGL